MSASEANLAAKSPVAGLGGTTGIMRISAWIAYGMGSSAYLLMIPTIGFATYFHAEIARGRPDADSLWAAVVAISLAIAGIAAPFLGAHADATHRRRRLLLLLTALACVLTATLSLTGAGDIVQAAIVFVGAHVAFMLAKAIYDSYLPQLGTRPSLPVISGAGWGLGYLGSIACFLLCLPFIRGGSETADPEIFRLAFLVTGVFFACLALPAIALLPADGRSTAGPGTAYTRIRDTVIGWREHRETFKFLLAFYLINDAIVTLIFFIGIYFKTNFGLTVEEILRLSLLFYAVGIPSTVAFGWLGRRWSERGALNVTLAVWIGLFALLAFGEGAHVPLAAVLIGGLVIGSSQALCRSIYARMIPPERSAEFFGFNALVGRASAVLGPISFGLVSAATGSQRPAMAFLSIFIVLGGLALALVRIPKT
ncbi:MAG: MFS transporter [Rhizobiales bacterium]|nr:MFS transporter [Hyphomicrobiales bacterium]